MEPDDRRPLLLIEVAADRIAHLLFKLLEAIGLGKIACPSARAS